MPTCTVVPINTLVVRSLIGEEIEIMFSTIEKMILEKLEKDLLDGTIPSDYHIKGRPQNLSLNDRGRYFILYQLS